MIFNKKLLHKTKQRIEKHGLKAGTGFLIKQITNPQTKIVFARISGTGRSDLFAILHPIAKKLLFRPQPTSIQFSQPEFLYELLDRDVGGKMIAGNVETLYRNYWEQ